MKKDKNKKSIGKVVKPVSASKDRVKNKMSKVQPKKPASKDKVVKPVSTKKSHEKSKMPKVARPKKSVSKGKVDKLVPVPIKRHFDSQGNHHHLIMGDIDNKHVSVGLTTRKKKGKNHTNIPLERDPLGTSKKSYMRRQAIVAPKNRYNSPKQGNMAKDDYAKATKIAERKKAKELEKKNKKK